MKLIKDLCEAFVRRAEVQGLKGMKRSRAAMEFFCWGGECGSDSPRGKLRGMEAAWDLDNICAVSNRSQSY